MQSLISPTRFKGDLESTPLSRFRPCLRVSSDGVVAEGETSYRNLDFTPAAEIVKWQRDLKMK